ncbi:hypothetical protein [Methylobacterium organophilum]|uniref:Uncharacterized protein n=1 Tax=Methylobacterium organophilum TaxID=410 RepID=A0ABQ4T5Y9_METOR|nr:hypothetical protein [Methylobacterium organophilum]GJE26728.1 hypothetical protein LKMONMHP_1579 [Methylobacterium organophilum]
MTVRLPTLSLVEAQAGPLVVGGYLCAFMLVGRPDDTYWILMVGPLLMPGLAFAPAALRDLGCAALPRRRGAGA